MSGSRPNPAGLALLFLTGLVSTSSAQEIVPGGWAPQVGFQSFSAPGFAGGGGDLGAVTPVMALPSPVGAYGGNPVPALLPLNPLAQAHPQVVNGLIPLGDAIRRSTGRRARR